MLNITKLAVLGGAVGLLGCSHVKATPVTPQPLSAEEAAQLHAALIGPCSVTEVQVEGGEPKRQRGLGFMFHANGSYSVISAANYGIPSPPIAYVLDGRNISLAGFYRNWRFDEFNDERLKFFVYENSTTYTCIKKK